VRRFTPDAEGNVEREEYFGGDLQNLSTSTDLCGLSLPANQYEIAHAYQFGVLSETTYVDENGELLPFHTLDLTIDPSTGLVAKSRDSAGRVKYFGFDARGHPRRKVDGPNDLTYYYDRAERLVRVRESWGQQRLLKSFTFADSNGPNDWRKGKLWKTNRHH